MTKTFEIEEFNAIDHNGKVLFWVAGRFKAECEFDWERGWEVQRITAGNNEPNEVWTRIDDVPECRAICRGIEAVMAEISEPEGYTDPNREHRLTAADLGVGRFA